MGVRWVWATTIVLLASGGCLRLGYSKRNGPGPHDDARLQTDTVLVDGSLVDALLADGSLVDASPLADGPLQDGIAPDPDALPATGWVVSSQSLTTVTLRGVWTGSPSQVYAVGDGGMVLFYDGSSWSKLTTTGLTADLHAVWGVQTSPSVPVSVYIVGAGPYVWHLVGNNWSDALQAPTSASLFDVWAGASIADLWAVGANGAVLRGQLPGSITQQTHTCTTSSLRTVIGGGSKIWMAGDGGKVCYDKNGIQELAHNQTAETLNAAWFDPTSASIWFVGDNHAVLHVDSGGIASLVPLQGNGHLRGIWGASPSDIWAVGGKGKILHYNGKSWSQPASPTTAMLYDVWGSSASNIWAVGEGGTVLRYLGGAP